MIMKARKTVHKEPLKPTGLHIRTGTRAGEGCYVDCIDEYKNSDNKELTSLQSCIRGCA